MAAAVTGVLAEVEKEIVRQAGLAKTAAVTATKSAGMVGKAGLTGTAGNGVQALATSGTIWSGKGLCLGLGLGLGAWGPILVVATGAAAIYAYREYRRRNEGGTDEEIEQAVTDEGFYPEEA